MPKINNKVSQNIKILNLVLLKCLELIKYNMEHTLVDYIELAVSISLTSGLGNKLITYLENDRFRKITKDNDRIKLISVIEDYIGHASNTKILLSKYSTLKGINVGQKITLVLDDLGKLPKDIKNSEVINIFKIGGTVEDSDILELGGFLDTDKIAYPLNLFKTIDRLRESDSTKKQTVLNWIGKIESYFPLISDSISTYLAKRAKYNNISGNWVVKTVGFDSIVDSINMIKKQDMAILRDKFNNPEILGRENIQKNMEIIDILRLNPLRRSEVIEEIENSITKFRDAYLDESLEIDDRMGKMIENLNRLGYDIDYLLSKENKITCINNIYLVLNTYRSVRDQAEYVGYRNRLEKMLAVDNKKDDLISEILQFI